METKPAAQLTRELLKLKDAPTCIIYPDDSSSIGGRNAIVEAGLRIGGDISIAGYDGNLISRLLHPNTHHDSCSKSGYRGKSDTGSVSGRFPGCGNIQHLKFS